MKRHDNVFVLVLFRPDQFVFRLVFFSVIKFEVEIVGVELVDPDVAVLTSGRVGLAVRVESERVDGTKVALHPAKLLLEDEVEEAGVELADPRGCRRHVHGLLTTAQHHLSPSQKKKRSKIRKSNRRRW